MIERANGTTADRDTIADALVARQGLDRSKADQLASRIAAADDDIADAAVSWAVTGRMPPLPAIEGQTPERLSTRFRPSQVFTGLIALRDDPVAATNVLRHPPSESPQSVARAWEERVADAVGRTPGVSSVRAHPVGPDRRSRPDLLVTWAGKTIVIEAKSTRRSPRALQMAIEQVERFVLVFEAHGGLVVVPDAPQHVESLRGYLAPVSVTDLDHLTEALEGLVADPASARRS